MRNKVIAIEGKSKLIEGPLKIMVVDDDKTIRNMWSTILSGYGYCIQNTFADGAPAFEALKLLKPEDRPDIILCDVNMPIMNGKELREALRSLGIWTKIIFMTGDGSDVFSEQERQTMLSKPFEVKDLLVKLFDVMPHQLPLKVRRNFPDLENKMVDMLSIINWGYEGVTDSKLLNMIKHDINNALSPIALLDALTGNIDKDKEDINQIRESAHRVRLIRKGIESAFQAYNNRENIKPENLYDRRNSEDDAKMIGEAICEIENSLLCMPGKSLLEYSDRLISFIKDLEIMIKAIIGEITEDEVSENITEKKIEANKLFHIIIQKTRNLTNHR